MNRKFILSVGFGMLWLAFSVWLSLPWIEETVEVLPPVYVWAVVIGIAFLPGYLMSAMFFSNLLHRRVRQYPQTCEDTTVILCAHNEKGNIAGTIQALFSQKYAGRICILAVDNASTDGSKCQIQAMARLAPENRPVRYLYCGQPGKANALNLGLSKVRTRHFLTVDADTWLEGLREVPPWRQSGCTRYFTSVNLSIIYLDLAYLFGFVPGVILALFGYCYLVGLLTVFTALVGALCFWTVYRYQKRLDIPFKNTLFGFILFLFFFQLVQSTASLHGYLSHLAGRRQSWK
ncbi:hypothetical protein B5G38_05060 [Gemmiger sp. An87]|nr:hypothetical protein B5G38_05060 [Gemmiger sp. An87]